MTQPWKLPTLVGLLSLLLVHQLKQPLYYLIFPLVTKLSRQQPGSSDVCYKAAARCNGCSEWTLWSQCSYGFTTVTACCKIITRTNNGKIEFVLATCEGNPVDGGVGQWLPWASCDSNDRLCDGGGVRKRNRRCDNPKPDNCGKECAFGSLNEVDYGTSGCVPRDGRWTEWTQWGTCTMHCGPGIRLRSRSCNPGPNACGQPCPGKPSDLIFCTGTNCGTTHPPGCVPRDGGWGEWMEWSGCPVTCGGQQTLQNRIRACFRPIPFCGGRPCEGEKQQNRFCGTGPCCTAIQHGGWSIWSTWTTCTATCNGGSQSRTRQCNNPTPACDGQSCQGQTQQSQQCGTSPCCNVQSGGWSIWSTWTTCSATCNGGSQSRTRQCNNPTPACGGQYCPGQSLESQQCGSTACCTVQNGGWSEWTTWDTCSVNCGGGVQSKTRQCNNPTPACGGQQCQGQSRQSQQCATAPCCPVRHGEWSYWSAWFTCSVTCGGGTQRRSRQCNNPTPLCGGQYCPGLDEERQQCGVASCCVLQHGGWSVWAFWTICSATCSGGSQSRTRQCNNPTPACGGQPCPGQSQESQQCGSTNTQHGGWSDWSPWIVCSVSCGEGTQSRTRLCNNPSPSCGGQQCQGQSQQSQQCATPACCSAETHGWNAWSAYGSCSRTCGEGTKQRSRTCKGQGSHCAHLCTGSYTESTPCVVTAGVDGGWGAWTSGQCSATCGSGVRTRSRTCNNPSPNLCGQRCPGDSIEVEQCQNLPNCCEFAGKTGAAITLSQQHATIGSDPQSEYVGVIITCRAIMCSENTLNSLTIGHRPAASTQAATVYASANANTDGGRANDKIKLARTQVSGSVTLNALTFVFSQVRCEDAGTYDCKANLRNSDGSNSEDVKSLSLTVTVKPSRFSLSPVGSTANLKVGDVLNLKCSGNVGTFNLSTQLEIVWEYQNKDSASWQRMNNPQVSTEREARAGSCETTIQTNAMRINVTTEDNGRKYRCYLKKDGTDNLDSGENEFSVNLNTTYSPEAKAFLIIEPDSVTLSNPNVVQSVMAMCSAEQSQNTLASLVLSQRLRKQATTVPPRELALTQLAGVVTDRAKDETIVGGGLDLRLINYTILQVSCMHDGMYFCTALTQTATAQLTDTQEKVLTVNVDPYHSNMISSIANGSLTSGSSVTFSCSTLTTDPDVEKALQWKWQYTDDPDASDAKWTDISDTAPGVKITSKTVRVDSQCFDISFSNLTIEEVTAEQSGRYYRCYAVLRDTAYTNQAGTYRMSVSGDPEAFKEENEESDLGSWLAWLLPALAALAGLCLLLIAVAACRKKRKPKEEPAPTPAFFGNFPDSESMSSGKPPEGLIQPENSTTTASESESSYVSEDTSSVQSDTVMDEDESSVSSVTGDIHYHTPGNYYD